MDTSANMPRGTSAVPVTFAVTAPAATLLAAVLLAGGLLIGGLVIGGLLAGMPGAAHGPPKPEPASGGAGSYQVSAAAQRGALAYWTPARMAATAGAVSAGAVSADGVPAGGFASGGSRDSGGPAQNPSPAGAPVAQSAWARSAPTAPKGTPTAKLFGGVPMVGALFYTAGGTGHFCTASVVDSAIGDLVITAAHCVYSQAAGYSGQIEFVPGYRDGTRPYGAWPVQKITVASGWRRSQDPGLDVAFLTVGATGSPHPASLQARTGGLLLGTGQPDDESITPVGYNDTDDSPVGCDTKSFQSRAGQLEFYCHDFQDGTSGGPWIAGFNPRAGTGTVIGVIGGYEQGGDYDWASYSAYFGSAVRELFQEAGGTARS